MASCTTTVSITLVRLSGTTFLILERGDNLLKLLIFELFDCRLIPSLLSGSLITRPSREPLENPPSLETRPLLSPTVPLIPIPSLLLRSGLPVEVGTEVFLSLVELPEREDLLELIRLLELPSCGRVTRALGSLVLILPPIREDMLELMRLPVLLPCGRVTRGLGVLVLIELPMRDDLIEPELPACGRVTRELGSLVLILLPMREDMLELMRPLELPVCGCVLRALGVLVPMELPIRDDLLELIRLPELPVCGCVLRALGVLVPMELPIRDDLLELIRLLELPVCGRVLRALGVLVLIELPMREDMLELIRPLELPVCGRVLRALGVLVLMELPMRDDLLELIRLLELVDVGLLLLIELLDGLRVLEVTPDLIVTGRLTGVRLDRLLVLPLLGRRTFTLLVILLEPVLRVELLRLEDLGVIVLVGALLTERDEVVVLEELDLLGAGCLLLDAEEDLEACWLLELLLLDLLLLLDDFSAKTGSMVSIKAKINVPTTILTFLWYFIVAIILLLK